MRFRNYLIQMADRRAFYVSAEDGMNAMKAYAKGENILVRGRLVAYHMVSVIRPCNAIEDAEAEFTMRKEDEYKQLCSGELEIKDNGTSFQLLSSPSKNVSMQKMLP